MSHPTTHQQVFDLVAVHLVAQNAKSESAPSVCAYRGPGGLMCAVGALIPNAAYNRAMEGDSAAGIIDNYPVLSWMKPFEDLLAGLQLVHDNSAPSTWPNALRQVARAHRLDSSILDTPAPRARHQLPAPTEDLPRLLEPVPATDLMCLLEPAG